MRTNATHENAVEIDSMTDFDNAIAVDHEDDDWISFALDLDEAIFFEENPA